MLKKNIVLICLFIVFLTGLVLFFMFNSSSQEICFDEDCFLKNFEKCISSQFNTNSFSYVGTDVFYLNQKPLNITILGKKGGNCTVNYNSSIVFSGGVVTGGSERNFVLRHGGMTCSFPIKLLSEISLSNKTMENFMEEKMKDYCVGSMADEFSNVKVADDIFVFG